MRRITITCLVACLAVTAGWAASRDDSGAEAASHKASTPAISAAAGAVGDASGPTAYEAAVHLSGKIGSRPSGSRNERRAHEYVASLFRSAGLEVALEPFSVPSRGGSRNV